MGQKFIKNDYIIILNLAQLKLYSYYIIYMKAHKQPLSHLQKKQKKNTGKASDFQWYLLPGISIQSCFLVVVTK